MTIDKAVAATIHDFVTAEQANMAGMLAELVKVPSDNPPGDCAPHAKRATQLLEKLGFTVERKAAPAFASVSLGPLRLLLSGPGASGSRPLPDKRTQEPGGWNRLVLEVDDVPARAAELKKAGIAFRNELETGPGGQQIQLEDPDGNPICLWEVNRDTVPEPELVHRGGALER